MKNQAKEMEASQSFSEELSEERRSIIECVRRWGSETTDAVLDPACKTFKAPDIEGLIGYRVEWGYAVVFGDPICSPDDKVPLAQAFHHYCQEQGYQIIYVIISEEFAELALKHFEGVLIEYGKRLILNPQHSPKDNKGVHGSLVRRKVKHALREGTTVHEYLPYDPQIEQAIKQVGISWLQSRHGPQIHISHVNLFNDRPGKRWFYAQQGERIIGVLLLNQLQVHQGWLMNHLMASPEAPHGTRELLVTTVLDILSKEDCHFVACGVVPLNQLEAIKGMNTFYTWLARRGYQIAKVIFHLGGHAKFWEKFEPQSKRSYLLFNQKSISLHAVASLMRAMNVSLKF